MSLPTATALDRVVVPAEHPTSQTRFAARRKTFRALHERGCFVIPNPHVGHPDPLRESVRRLQAYAAAGADVLFAPGPQTSEEIEALVEAVAPKPFNLLVVRDIGLGVGEIAALGVRRISVGGALALAAWTGFIRAAQTLRSEGSFAGLANLVPYAEVNGLFGTDLPGHQTARERAT